MKAMDNVLAAAAAWKQEARKLLDESRLPAVLGLLGELQYTGSYEYDVMLGADIDVYVIVPAAQAKTAALKALTGFIEQNYWNGYLFYDFVAHPSTFHAGFPEAYYVGVKGDFGGHRWKVNIWFGESAVLNHDNDWIKPGMTDENRAAILLLKQARDQGTLSAESHAIYKAVIVGGVKDVSAFLAWQQRQKEKP